MKITNKIKVVVIPAILLPLFFMVVLLYFICSYELNSDRYDEDDSKDIFSIINATEVMNSITNKIFNNIQTIAVSNPKAFEDNNYLNEINENLLENSSYLIVRKNQEIIYSGVSDFDSEIKKILPEYGGVSVEDVNGGLYISEPEKLLIKQQDFKYSDKSDGSIFIITTLEKVKPYFTKFLIRIVTAIVMVVIVTCLIISYLVYYEFVRPIKLLKDATDRIKEGDLTTDVEVLNNDEIGELCVSFNEMRARLKESIDDRLYYEEENRELISNISHDLKTPITAIKGYVEGIMDGVANTPEKMDKYMKTIYNKANDMNILINELSLYTKIDCNSMPYNFSKLDIDSFFGDCIDEIKMDLEKKNMELAYFNYCKEKELVVADPEQLKRVINNIVINAAKYNDKKKGHVNIRIKDIGDYIQIEIEDDGQGISEKDLPFIFNRLYRADASRNSSKGGSGLGLSIAKKIIEEHDGKIWASSKKDTGTIIYFTLKKVKEL